MRLAMMIIGTLLAVFLIIKYIKGKKYADLIEGLEDDNEYPLKDFYVIGFSMNDNSIFKIHDKNKDELISQAKLLYDSRYSEYYAMVAWAQTLTFAYLGVVFGFIIGGIFNSIFFVLVGAIFAAALGNYFYTKMKNKVESRKEDCVSELPEVVSTIAMLMNSGMTLKEVWELVANSKEGTVYSLMKQSCIDMKNGMTEKEAIDLLFRPSFSTSEKITDVSGRGVGLDVVKSKIEALGGDVEVKTKYGEGSTFSIRLPLTLAIIQALMVKLGDEKYAISLGAIETIEDVPVTDIKYIHAKEVINLRGSVIPLIRLRDILDVPGEQEESDTITVVIVRKGDKLAGLVVDSLIGQMEIVIKSLGKYININRMISGATILGDGSVALIIDANTLV